MIGLATQMGAPGGTISPTGAVTAPTTITSPLTGGQTPTQFMSSFFGQQAGPTRREAAAPLPVTAEEWRSWYRNLNDDDPRRQGSLPKSSAEMTQEDWTRWSMSQPLSSITGDQQRSGPPSVGGDFFSASSSQFVNPTAGQTTAAPAPDSFAAAKARDPDLSKQRTFLPDTASADPRALAASAIVESSPPSPFAGWSAEDVAAINAISNLYQKGLHTMAPGSLESMGADERKLLFAGGARLGYSPVSELERYALSRPGQGASNAA
jgi:hypothetical protein